MKKIDGSPASLKDILQNSKYAIHYYQREYMWQRKQIEELIDDLTEEFLHFYDSAHDREDVKTYGVYFMGSVVFAGFDHAVIDGQQRLSSLTLLLIYLRRRMLKNKMSISAIDQMIYSESYGKASFNIAVEDREPCLEALNEGKAFDPTYSNESIQNLYARYQDIIELFPKEIDDRAIPFFADWLSDKVYVIKIVAEAEQDAHKVFVSMNDRGLSLTSAEMLKGYLLSEVESDQARESLNSLWKKQILALRECGKGAEEDCLKAWLRAQYAETIRENKKDSNPGDYDLIGGAFHKWVRDERAKLGLKSSTDFEAFIKEFSIYADLYVAVKSQETCFNSSQPHVFYNSQLGFTLQTQLIFAAINADDSAEIKAEKTRLVSRFIDLLIYTRVFNYRSMDYSTIKNWVFKTTKQIRHLDIKRLEKTLSAALDSLGFTMETGWSDFRLNQYTKKYIKHMLARITDRIETGSGFSGNYLNYIAQGSKNPYEVEHIITDHYEWYVDDYSSPEEFQSVRNNPGNLLLLGKSTNASINDSRYEKKIPVYMSSGKGNVLAASLCEQYYENNPGLKKYGEANNYNFEAYNQFGKEEVFKRNKLLYSIIKDIWKPLPSQNN